MTRWHSDALAAPHTQRELGEGAGDKPCPRRGALQAAIEEVKDIGQEGNEFEPCEFEDYFMDNPATAIATILNAVVKGELK